MCLKLRFKGIVWMGYMYPAWGFWLLRWESLNSEVKDYHPLAGHYVNYHNKKKKGIISFWGSPFKFFAPYAKLFIESSLKSTIICFKSLEHSRFSSFILFLVLLEELIHISNYRVFMKIVFFLSLLQPLPLLHRCKTPSELSTQCECTVTPIG